MALSNQIVLDGDYAFLGLQSRRNPLSMQPGYLQSASNVRLDKGMVQVRKGSKNPSSSLSSGSSKALVLPFYLSAGLTGSVTISQLSRSGTVGTITTSTNLTNLTVGQTYALTISGVTYSAGYTGTATWNGSYAATLTATNRFTITCDVTLPTSASGNAIIINATVANTYESTLSNYYSGGFSAAGVFSSPNYDAANEWVVVAGPASAQLWRNGTTPISKTYPTSPVAETIQQAPSIVVTVAITGTIATVSAAGMYVPVGTVVTLSSSVAQTNAILSANYSVATSSLGSFTVTVPSGTTVPTGTLTLTYSSPDQVTLLQAYNKMFLYRWRSSDVQQPVTSIVVGTAALSATTALTAAANSITATVANHGMVVGQVISISGKVGVESVLNGTWVVTGVPTTSTFTFTVTTAPSLSALTLSSLTYSLVGSTPTATATSTGHPLAVGNQVTIAGATPAGFNGTFTVTAVTANTFTYTVGGTLTTPATGTITATPLLTATVINFNTTTATVTMPQAHGFSTGEVVRLSGSDRSGFNLDTVITVPNGSTTTFTVTVPNTTLANGGTMYAQRVQCPLYWDGGSSTQFVRVPTGTATLGPTYSNMVSPYNAIATYFNNQVILGNSRDGVLVSDILDPFTYDPLAKSFRANIGSNDYLVAVHPYADGQCIVFMRRSIYLATITMTADGSAINPGASTIRLLTNEIGCNARNTIATAGNYVYFLSDNGVYRLDNAQIDLALRGNTLPLSEPISDIISGIQLAYVAGANAVYFNNRYYVAVPNNTNPSTASQNNTVLVYNQLNEAWESVDTYNFTVDRLLVTDYGSTKRLFAVSFNGNIMLLEENDNAQDDQRDGLATDPVTGSITTRRFFYNQLSHKRMGIATVSAYLPGSSTVAVSTTCIDRDHTDSVVSVTNSGDGNDYTIKGPIRRTAVYLDVKVTMSGGRPTIRGISADATIPSDISRISRTES